MKRKYLFVAFASWVIVVVGLLVYFLSARPNWSEAPSMHFGRSGHTATLLLDGRVLVAGGGNEQTTCELFDRKLDQWTPAASMIYPHLYQFAVRLRTGKVLVGGGFNSKGTGSVDCEIYDPTTDKWTVTGSLRHGRWCSNACVLADGNVMVIGGTDPLGANDGCELYNSVLGIWREIRPAGKPGVPHLIADGRVMVIGASGDWRIYDPKANSWGPLSPLAKSVDLPLNEASLVGICTDEVFDPKTRVWTSRSSRYPHVGGIQVLADGKILKSGGMIFQPNPVHPYLAWLNLFYKSAYPRPFYNLPLLKTLSTCVIYDPTTGKWTRGPEFRTPRYLQGVTVLDNGDVLVTGGWLNGTNLSSCEIISQKRLE